MPAPAVRVYADTSVFGGCFDEEFAAGSSAFFREVREGLHTLVSSALVEDELVAAPERVRQLLAEFREGMDLVEITPAVHRLREAYLRAGIVAVESTADALHVALATVSGCRAIVSWNFRHIVHFRKIPLYNGVNLVEGYGAIGIHTPWEVLHHGIEYEAV